MPLRVNSAWNSFPRHVTATCPLVWADVYDQNSISSTFLFHCRSNFGTPLEWSGMPTWQGDTTLTAKLCSSSIAAMIWDRLNFWKIIITSIKHATGAKMVLVRNKTDLDFKVVDENEAIEKLWWGGQFAALYWTWQLAVQHWTSNHEVRPIWGFQSGLRSKQTWRENRTKTAVLQLGTYSRPVFDEATSIQLGFLEFSSLILSFPRVINVKFPVQPHQKYNIPQYEELGFPSLTQMKDHYTADSHYIVYTFFFKWLGEYTFWTWEWKGLRLVCSFCFVVLPKETCTAAQQVQTVGPPDVAVFLSYSQLSLSGHSLDRTPL